MAKRLTERVSAPFTGCVVDRDAGTVSGVLICGASSENGRDYPADVFRRDYRAYEGRPVNCDHGREATVDRRFGWFSGVKVGEDGRPRGTLHALKSHPMYERVMEAAERNPSLFGFSHVALCDTRRDGGREVIEAIRSVESIDLVAEPATTKGLFEGKPVPTTLKQFAESFARRPKATTEQILRVKRLAEMDGMGDLSMGDPPAEDAEPEDGVKDAFKTAVMHIVGQALDGEMDPKEALGKIKELIASHGKVNGAAPEKEPPAEPDGDEAGAKESKQAKAADPIAVLTECKALGYDPGVAELKTLCLMEAADRTAHVREQLKKFAESRAEKPKSGAARRVAEQAAPPAPAKDAQEFVSRLFSR